MSLLTPFVVVIVAERLHTSSVVAVVVAGLYLGHRIPYLMSADLAAADGRGLAADHLPARGHGLPAGRPAAARPGQRPRDRPGHHGRRSPRWSSSTLVVVRFVWMYPATYLARLIPRIRAREERPPIARADGDRLGRHARRGDAGRRADPAAERRGGRRLPARPVRLRRVRDHRADPADPGHDAADGWPGASASGRTPAPRTRWPRRRCSTRPAGRRWSALEDHADGAPDSVVERLRALADSRGQQRLGAAGQSAAGNPVRGVRSAASRDDRRRAPRLQGSPATRGASPRRCSTAPSATWTWKNPS